MIRTFHQLDSSKVLLDRVVHALQLYLCQRDDAIRIVVTGLLSNPTSTSTDDSKRLLVELAVLLNEASQQQRTHVDDEHLDWDDMTWVPDPVDAGPNYKRPKNEDVVGTLINALGSQEIFIKEFQIIIAERLLSNQAGFQQEIKVLSLLKKRFGETALQNCDVMVRDIYDSKRVDALLRKSLRSADHEQTHPINYHSKILSRLFWPSLPKDSFTVPAPVAEVQSQYEQGFEQLKTSRKLTWLDHLGVATVRLDFQDRSIEQECKTYEAAVIYAFQDDDSTDAPLPRTFDQLWEKLMIDEDLLESSLRFWVSKRVLRDVGSRTYVVIERLDEEGSATAGHDAGSIGEAEEITQSSPRKPKMDPKEQERRTVYWQFIVGMLTNSGPAMPLGQIAMMMKMLIAGGCPWSNEELQDFLAEKIAEGEMELSGGKYRLVKK
jgi:anaphase-promoting complex subunit 2